MSTLFDKSNKPLWLWILIIVIGSLVVLGLLALLVRYLVLRRREHSSHDFISDEPAEKKLTLRRGRIVPATNYLSLTGSRFGINSITGEDNIHGSSIRSKSPFEWWANLKGRSSRLSYVSHVSSAHCPTSPRPGSFYQRPDLSTSKLSLTSKDDGPRATVSEITLSKPPNTLQVPSLARSSRNFEPVNFSRAFTAQTQRSLAASRSQTLSRIEEVTPHQSMMSTKSLKTRTGSFPASEHGQSTDHRASLHMYDTSMPSLPPSQPHSRQNSENTFYETVRYQTVHEQPLAQHPPGSFSSPQVTSSPLVQEDSRYSADITQVLHPRQSLWGSTMRQYPCIEHHTEQEVEDDHTHDHQSPQLPTGRHSLRNSAAVTATFPSPNIAQAHFVSRDYQDEEQNYTQDSRISTTNPLSFDQSTAQLRLPTGPFRTHSKKGNVLRKKSLERNRVLSQQY